MRLIPLLFLIPAALSAETIVNGITIDQTVRQLDESGGEILVTFSAPITGFDLVALTPTDDKMICWEVLFSIPRNCLFGIIHNARPGTPYQPGVSSGSMTFHVADQAPFTEVGIAYQAQSLGDEMTAPALTFTSVTPEASAPEPASFALAIGAFVLISRLRRRASFAPSTPRSWRLPGAPRAF